MPFWLAAAIHVRDRSLSAVVAVHPANVLCKLALQLWLRDHTQGVATLRPQSNIEKGRDQ